MTTDTPVLSDEEIAERILGLLEHDDGDHGTCSSQYCAVCSAHWSKREHSDAHTFTPKACDCDARDLSHKIVAALPIDSLRTQVDQLTRERDEARRRFDQREWYVKDMEGTLDDIRDAFDMKGRDPDAMIARAKASRPFDVEKVQAIADAAIHAEDHIGMSMFANEEEWRGARRYEVARVISEELHRLIGGKS